MNFAASRRSLLLTLPAVLLPVTVSAQETLRVGLLLTYSGSSSLAGQVADNTVKLFQSMNGLTAGGRKIEFVRRDTTGPNPEVARRLAQELIVREKVGILIGPDFTPNVLAVAPLLTEARIPAIQTGSATSGIVGEKSPYYLRTFFSIPQVVRPMAQWAHRNGVRKPFVVVADYGPGHDAEATFVKSFQERGAAVAGVLKIPPRNPEFSSYLQRIKDASPDAVFVFLPIGELCVQFLRAYADSGLKGSPIRLLGTGDLTDELYLEAAGDAALGVVTTGYYSASHDSAMNRDLVSRYEKAYGKPTPAVNVWDALRLVYDGVAAQPAGKFDPNRFIAFARGRQFESPRGPIAISGDNGDIVQNVYMRRVERRDGKLVNVEFETIPPAAQK
ncbi:MAG TPA: ABC transporter substrate-binding protein [Burkholderiaceae bacterium]|nr:ABC transporter substrate-binding protein [Burkholderiaceae bacterium]